MCPQETPFERLRASLGYVGEWNAGGVGGDNRPSFGDLLDASHQLLLGLQPLDDSFEDPVSFFETLKVVLEVAEANVLCQALVHQSSRLGFEHTLKACLDDAIALLPLLSRGDDIQQVDQQTGVGCVSRDGCSHGSGSQHVNAQNVMGHNTTSSIRIRIFV